LLENNVRDSLLEFLAKIDINKETYERWCQAVSVSNVRGTRLIPWALTMSVITEVNEPLCIETSTLPKWKLNAAHWRKYQDECIGLD